ncbi:YtxH domain-containing protein [Lentibacillus salinarum]|uniref:YtxH domain-containing protein n=1 Tax=Lentibacillus salinarum TaxID=446820 RepID=A0ABW3ZV51_9BACI
MDMNKKAKNSERSVNNKDFLLGTLIGGLTGAVAALLWAPKSGSELRGDLNNRAVELKDRTGEWKDAAYEKGADWKDTASQKGSEVKEKAYLKGSELRTRAVDSTSKLSRKTQAKTQELSKSIQDKLKRDDGAAEVAATEESAVTAESDRTS